MSIWATARGPRLLGNGKQNGKYWKSWKKVVLTCRTVIIMDQKWNKRIQNGERERNKREPVRNKPNYWTETMTRRQLLSLTPGVGLESKSVDHWNVRKVAEENGLRYFDLKIRNGHLLLRFSIGIKRKSHSERDLEFLYHEELFPENWGQILRIGGVLKYSYVSFFWAITVVVNLFVKVFFSL
jgi:hypothetical protein